MWSFRQHFSVVVAWVAEELTDEDTSVLLISSGQSPVVCLLCSPLLGMRTDISTAGGEFHLVCGICNLLGGGEHRVERLCRCAACLFSFQLHLAPDSS